MRENALGDREIIAEIVVPDKFVGMVVKDINELRERKLVKATPPGMTGLELLMDVRAYRGKPSTKEASKGPAQALWAFLEAQSAAA